MPESTDPLEPFREMFAEKDNLTFLRDEGLEMLALFRSIKDRDKRQLVLELARSLADTSPPKER